MQLHAVARQPAILGWCMLFVQRVVLCCVDCVQLPGNLVRLSRVVMFDPAVLSVHVWLGNYLLVTF